MKYVLWTILLVVCATRMPVPVLAQPVSLELDIDGQLGEGPDTVSVEQGEFFSVAMWITGASESIIMFGVSICNFDQVLFYDGAVLGPELQGWQLAPVIGPPCYDVVALDPTHVGVAPPFLAATLLFEADGDVPTTILSIDESGSYWLDLNGEPMLFDSAIGLVVRIGTTATGATTWGGVKAHFRY